MSKGIQVQISEILDDYCEEVQAAADKAAEGTAKKTVAKLKKESPRGKSAKHYADGWRSKKDGKHGRIVYNATKPGLTHLLNNGHAKADGTGYVKGDDHITKASEFAQEDFERRVVDLL